MKNNILSVFFSLCAFSAVAVNSAPAFGQSASADLESSEVRWEVSNLLDAVSGVCEYQKIDLLRQNLRAINTVIEDYFSNPYFLDPSAKKPKLAVYLNDVRANISPFALSGGGQDQTYDFVRLHNQEEELKNNFLRHYYNYFNIKDGGFELGVDVIIPDEWAVSIYRGLSCLKSP